MDRRTPRRILNEKTVDAYFAAWNRLNTDDPALYYAKDKGLVFFDVTPFEYRGWSNYKKGVEKNFFGKVSGGKLTRNDDLKIIKRGRVAWMSLSFHLALALKAGGKIEFDCRHTAIWEKRRGRWLIVHEHISVPLRA